MTLDGVDRVAVDHDRVLRLEVVEDRGQIGHGRLEELLAEPLHGDVVVVVARRPRRDLLGHARDVDGREGR